jgi:hypothetical protein
MLSVKMNNSNDAYWRRRPRTVLLIVGLFLTLIICETGVRLLSKVDADGNVTFLSRRLKPFQPPVERLRALLEKSPPHDPHLGWAPRPSSESEDGMYRYDTNGIRVDKEEVVYSMVPPAGVRRIALFGDSFTHGDGVAFESSWGKRLEDILREQEPVEVLNFGFGGYGTDQAFLRWKLAGKALSPNVVVLGFQPENMGRNLNLIRILFYWETGVPFSKPRFVIHGDRLRLVNSPTIPPDQLPGVVEDLVNWDLRQYEHFFDESDYTPRIWSASRFLSVTFELLSRLSRDRKAEERNHYRASSPGGELILRIVAAFAADVESTGAEFWIIHLPRRDDLRDLQTEGQRLAYEGILHQMKSKYNVIDPVEALLTEAQESSVDSLFISPTDGHYSELGNQVVAQVASGSLSSK